VGRQRDGGPSRRLFLIAGWKDMTDSFVSHRCNVQRFVHKFHQLSCCHPIASARMLLIVASHEPPMIMANSKQQVSDRQGKGVKSDLTLSETQVHHKERRRCAVKAHLEIAMVF